jgi:sRNA-binding carbon storage regulator CsrA
MLVLQRKEGDRVLLETTDGPIWLTMLRNSHGNTCIGIEAPKSVAISREEILPKEKQHK